MDCFCSKSKVIHCKIILLDEQELIHEIENTANGQSLLDVVFRNLNLLETAYFGLRYLDQTGQTHWLDPSKAINKQIKGPDPHTFYFGVKFYAADPCKLLEEITRYQFFLQVKQDILQERLLVPFELAAELGAYVVQSELGDYDPRRHSKSYVSEFRFLPNQSIDLENRIAELHKTLIGQLPSVAELNYLEKVKWLEMYGVDLHPVLGEDNVEYFLGLTPSGIIVLRNKTTVGNYYWPRITKIYFKGRYFMLRVIDKNNDESTYGFETPSKSGCKHLWKCCVEHHAFFRLVQVTPTSPDIFALGSRFRYSGRTEKQAVKDAQMKIRTPPSFSRTSSRRYQRRTVEGVTNEETYTNTQFSQEMKFISVPQPAQNTQSNFATPFDENKRSDSPRSIKSAPWSQPHSKGLYNNLSISPRSVRSAGPRYRSSSLDSQSSNDSRSFKKRKHRSNKLTSDNESELSKSSNRSHRKHRRRKSKGNRRDSESEAESDRNHSRNRKSDSQYELVNSDFQWQQVQRKLYSDGYNGIQHANVVSNRHSRRTSNSNNNNNNNNNNNSNNNNTNDNDYNSKVRKHRKHRSRSRSPSEQKSWLSEELKKHLEFDLIDTTGMSENQLKEIPYTVVQTNNSKQIKLKHSWNKSHHDKTCNTPPPPYSPHIVENQRMRNLNTYNNNNNNNNNTLSHQLESVDSLLPRMITSLDLNYHSNNIVNPTIQRIHDNIYDHMRISHEHTDSGLGTEQECFNGDKVNDRGNSNHFDGRANGSNGNEIAGIECSNSTIPTNNTENHGTNVSNSTEMSTEL